MKNFDESIFEKGLVLPLVEDFYTLQGEGYHTGKAAYFIRIGGCDIGCRWCDSKISWNPSIHPLVSVDTIVSNALKTPANAVVVTGGEPSLYNLVPLTTKLKEHGIQTFIETAGAKPLTGQWDWICLSPKRQSPPDESYYSTANELKVIIFDDDDYRWAENIAGKMNPECKLFLQSEWSRYEQNIPEIVEYVKTYPKWNVSLQAHKFMHIP
ncbi:MAG: 7-carboxy-7-deazaguanine synthase QueE [Bacteroidetes bacterium GWC2_33_15]|nr:MAG: 7-carboxy-7-deazaguanine synthase QueE [Bacteroidetes bacterium GWA2_33_15]OFX48644.1 MAG: 7-carboxy-7-deazaguanine synthase QueE [Bacteroidetes bacterium GWC2_33_15]OFX64618.1 MAG: 7-carboxy-7-deazaguanine synthase QueE [Bacteroidetes bacterium GWB2_32_14]OFX67964.1 MAG: 7-carboxy-7-deazaguanine synthase QueE [Bacteroidetes bacterium GWD2_33_33]HAN18196.1 7-carboxy-7-deazaguanine synthase QueE [Bacteroidales bacterium]